MVVQVKLLKRHGCLFAGEIGGFPEHIAQQIIANRGGQRVLEDGSLEPLPEIEEPQSPAAEEDQQDRDNSGSRDEGNAAGNEEQNEPFIRDGLDKATAKALHANGLDTPAEVEEYILSGMDLVDLDDIGEKRAKEILAIYGPQE